MDARANVYTGNQRSFHLIKIAFPIRAKKNEYHNLVSASVLKGGRSIKFQYCIMKIAIITFPIIPEYNIIWFDFLNKPKAMPIIQIIIAEYPNILKSKKSIFYFFTPKIINPKAPIIIMKIPKYT